VSAFEAEAKALLAVRARSNGVGWRGVTPHVALAWIRGQLGVDDALHRQCAQALRDRDGLAEPEGRDLAPEEVRAHVEVLGHLTRLARRAREAAG
jgi:hypothetical protein